jgi:two-component system, cell cycle sensor histidine kinase and response regulator CckA
MSDEAAAGSTTPVPSGRGRVLVVDDDDAVRAVLALLLGRLGFEAHLAGSGPAACEFLSHPPGGIHCILLDSLMPGMDGLRTLEAMRSLAPETPVIVMSGNLSATATAEFTRLGVKVLLPKPFGLQELAAALTATVN